MKNKLESFTFEELVNLASSNIHIALLEEGGKGMKSEIYKWMSQAIEWSKGQKK